MQRIFIKLFIIFFLSQFLYRLLPIQIARAQESSLGVTLMPSIFNINLAPGDTWTSSLKVVNPNLYDISLSIKPVNFEIDRNNKKVIPSPETSLDVDNTLAKWITFSEDTVLVGREKSVDVPFSIIIPDNAPPGGHQAALLVSPQLTLDNNKPPPNVSILVSSIVFVKIQGEIKEGGEILNFRSQKKLIQNKMPDFKLIFRNFGNTHLQPTGSISIFNLWGNQIIKIPFPENELVGWVPRESTKEFIVKFTDQDRFLTSGLYKAVLNLDYGNENKISTSRTNHFIYILSRQIVFIISFAIIIAILVIIGIKFFIDRTYKSLQQELSMKNIIKIPRRRQSGQKSRDSNKN